MTLSLIILFCLAGSAISMGLAGIVPYMKKDRLMVQEDYRRFARGRAYG